MQHQGVERFADVYFPAGYSASSPAPLWFVFHGLYIVKPAANGGPAATGGLDHIKRAAEHVAGSMGINTGWLAKEAVLVYPDSTGRLPGFQMWNSGYWQCPDKSRPSQCMDSATDDVGFLEALVRALQEKLPSKPTHVYAMGFSNGGMILQALLCKSPYFQAMLTRVALVNTVLRKGYLDKECAGAPAAANDSSSHQQQQQQRRVPLVFIHGLQDELFPFFEGSSSATGDVLLSTLEMADAWAAKYGCSGSSGYTPLVLQAGEGVACRDLCTAAATAGGSSGNNAAAAAAGQPPAALWVCGMQHIGHDWTPFKADLSWTFFTQREQQSAVLPEPKFPTWQVPAAPAGPALAVGDAESPPTPPAQPAQQQPSAHPDVPEQPQAAAAAVPAVPTKQAAAVTSAAASQVLTSQPAHLWAAPAAKAAPAGKPAAPAAAAPASRYVTAPTALFAAAAASPGSATTTPAAATAVAAPQPAATGTGKHSTLGN